MSRMPVLQVCLLTLVSVSMTLAYPTGAPPFACPSIDPKDGHGLSTATGPAPYQVTFSKSQYRPGEIIEVTLSGKGAAQFKGFLIVGLKAGDSSPFDQPHGNFSVDKSKQSQITCNSNVDGNGVTHTNPGPKSSLTFQWRAPSKDVGDIVFRYAVVRGGAPNITSDPRDYFSQLASPMLKGPSTNAGSFKKDSQCGTEKGCYSNCEDDLCNWQIMFGPKGDKIHFDFKASLQKDQYVSFGLSQTGGMSPASVLTCQIQADKVSVVASNNIKGVGNKPLKNQLEGISNMTGSYENGILHCNFFREKVSFNPLIYNSSDGWFFITAKGDLKADGNLTYHGKENRFFTDTKLSVENVTLDVKFPQTHDTTTKPTSITTPTQAGSFKKDSHCGTEKGCYSNCEDDLCNWQIMFGPKGDKIQFDFKASLQKDQYVSFGLSQTGGMSPASVLTCQIQADKVSVVASNNIKGVGNKPLKNQLEGISNMTGSYENGILHCNFFREKVSFNPLIYNSSDGWFFITAKGDLKADGNLTYHGKENRFFTDTKLSVENVTLDVKFPQTHDTTTKPTSITTPTQIGTGSFKKDSKCGTEMGCYSNCADNVCDWQIMFAPENGGIRLDLKSTFFADNQYLALGFSEKSAMYPSSVVSCLTQQSKTSLVLSHNPSYSNIPIKKEGISDFTGSYKDGVLHCNFLRQKASSNPFIYNLTNSWYLITARGAVKKDGSLQYHGTNDRFKTSMKVSVENVTLDMSFPRTRVITTPKSFKSTAPTPTSKFSKDPECGRTKGCYSDCDDGTCSLMLSWQKRKTDFEITLKVFTGGSDNKWIALGFSDRPKMGDASVVECVVHNGNISAFASFNKGTSNSRISPDPRLGIKKVAGSFKDGILSCTFLRVTSMLKAQMYDLNKEWYLVTAKGDTNSDGEKIPHSLKNCFLTKSRINFADPHVDISKEEPSFGNIKIHACFMIVAWMLAASIGIAVARFFKPIFPETLICGVKVWFVIHRTAMMTTFCFGVAAFIIIFVEIDGYSEIVGEDYKKAHPILGIIVTSLLVINPLMSLLRCKPDDPLRPLFNFAHFSVGISAHILSAVTIALGMYLPKAQVDGDQNLIIILAYGAWQVLFFVIMSKLDRMEEKEQRSHLPVAKGTNYLSMSENKGSSQSDLKKLSIDDTIESSPLNQYKEETCFKVKEVKAGMMVCHVLLILIASCYLIYTIIDTDDVDS